jgi:KaiC/GvpD/RAD55 family RecA-like ATPase
MMADAYYESSFFPPELLKILELPYGYSLLVKGEGGNGKTTLALEMLVRAGGKNATYISTRVSPAQLFEHFPWVTKEVKENIVVLDATQAGTTMDHPFQGQQIGLKFTGMPDLLRKIIEIAEESAEQHFFVIDSWDAIQLLFQYNQVMLRGTSAQMTENLNFLYNTFMSLVREHNIKMILIAEDVSTMDYLVDGIVELRRLFLPGSNKLVREMVLKKFRGVRINNPYYIFTLEHGRFKAFMPWNLEVASAIRTQPFYLSYNDKNLVSIMDWMQNSPNKHRIGTILFDQSHPELIDVWIENLAGMQVYDDELFTFIPSNTFDVMAFKNKVLSYIRANGFDEDRYYRNIKIYLFDSNDDRLSGEEYITQIPPIQDDSDQEKELGDLQDLLVSNLVKFMETGQFKLAVNFASMTTIRAHFHDDNTYMRMLLNLNAHIDSIPESIYLVGSYAGDINSRVEDIIKASQVVIETDFIHGTPFFNFRQPQVPYLYGLLSEPHPEIPESIEFKIFPIV